MLNEMNVTVTLWVADKVIVTVPFLSYLSEGW
jgi:hypothetical protein